MKTYSKRILFAACAACVGASIAVAGAALALGELPEQAQQAALITPTMATVADNATILSAGNNNGAGLGSSALNAATLASVEPAKSIAGPISLGLLFTAFLCMGWLARQRRPLL
jgi:hypothetical protein